MLFSIHRLVFVAVGLTLGLSQAAFAEEDSAYQWGRWAVLSPAAGGAEPYAGVETPGAEFNLRPGDAFEPEVASFDVPVVPPVADDPRDRLPPRPPVADDPRDRLPPR